MITDEETTNIVNKVIEANKQLFYSKDEIDKELDDRFDVVNNKLDKLYDSVISFAKSTRENGDEIKVINSRATEQETWIKKAADKVGVEYKA